MFFNFYLFSYYLLIVTIYYITPLHPNSIWYGKLKTLINLLT